MFGQSTQKCADDGEYRIMCQRPRELEAQSQTDVGPAAQCQEQTTIDLERAIPIGTRPALAAQLPIPPMMDEPDLTF